ncbi:MAG: FAD-dependent oxidoreductase [Candidatus Coatesbacteria bacterium]
MNTWHEPAREIPVARDTDVVVAGGGPAGLAAAIASARNGAKTTLVERFGFLGGVATAGLMANLNGFRNQVEPDATQTVRGIAEEIVLELKKMNGLGKSPYPQKAYADEAGQMAYSYAIDTEKVKYVVMKMCADAGVDLLLHTWVAAPIVEDAKMRGIVVENKSGREALLARVVIDATGDGDVAARAGAPFWSSTDESEPRLGDSLMYRIRFGAKHPADLGGMDFGADMIVWGPFSKTMDGTNADAISKAEVAARLAVYTNFAAMQAKHPDLVDAKVAETPVMFGVRQTRFIEGEYKVTGDDAIAGTRFPDSIAMSSCAIIGYYGYRRYLTHQGYDIPYRCLVPRVVDQLLIAGRCISSDQRAYESHRAMIPMMAIGQAAGTAAALSARQGVAPRRLDVGHLQRTLTAQGAVIRIPSAG